MKRHLAKLCALVASIATAGLLWATISLAWFPSKELQSNALLALLGFGVPMLLLGIATLHFLAKEPRLLIAFGWVCTILSLVWAICLLAFVAGCVGLLPHPSGHVDRPRLIEQCFIFGIPMVICGYIGVGIVVYSESDHETNSDGD